MIVCYMYMYVVNSFYHGGVFDIAVVNVICFKV